MKKDVKDDVFIRQPVYPGGNHALNAYLAENIKYPQDALESKTEGIVELRIYIDHQGHVYDAKILGSLSTSCNEEAIRLVKTLKFLIPKNPRNLKISFQKILRVQFKIPKKKDVPTPSIQGTKIVYHHVNMQYQSSKANDGDVVYSYQIKIK
jgi:TonB family protein